METLPVTLKPKTRRLLFIVCAGLAGGIIATLLFSLLSESLIFFYTPSDLVQKYIPYGQKIRVGGVVLPQSLSKKGETVSFQLTDHKAMVEVHYTGPLPELFREGQETIAEGEFQGPSLLNATSILAKHDEIYRPRVSEPPSTSSPPRLDN